MSCALSHDCFALRQVVQGISVSHASGPTNVWIDGRAGGGVSDRYVSLPVHVDAGHPPEQTVVIVRPVLLLGRGSGNSVAGHVELIPADRRRPRVGGTVIEGSNSLISINGFYAA